MRLLKNNKGITLTMLTITIIVLLIIASTLAYFTVSNDSIINNAQTAKFKEKMSDIKSRVDEKILTKQELLGDDTATLTETESKEILGEYYPDELTVVNSKLKYKKNSKFTKEEREILNKLNINEVN